MMNTGRVVFVQAVLLVMFAVACVPPEGLPGPQGERGNTGATGADGPRGPQGEPGRDSSSDAYIYVDGWGKPVGPTSIKGYVDPDGTLWQVDPETGAVSPLVLAARNVELSESDTCQPALKVAFPPEPRAAFRLPTDPSGTHRVRGDRDLLDTKQTRSQRWPDGSCGPTPHGTTPVPMIPLPPLRDGGGSPSGGLFYGPLHIQRR